MVSAPFSAVFHWFATSSVPLLLTVIPVEALRVPELVKFSPAELSLSVPLLITQGLGSVLPALVSSTVPAPSLVMVPTRSFNIGDEINRSVAAPATVSATVMVCPKLKLIPFALIVAKPVPVTLMPLVKRKLPNCPAPFAPASEVSVPPLSKVTDCML